MKLKEQTVYIPIGINEANESTFVTMSKVRGQIHLKQENKICLSKEELIELLGIAWQGGKDFENAGWNNQEYLMGLPEIPKEQFINQLIDNTKQ